MGYGAVLALGVLVTAAVVVLTQAHRAQREIDQVSASIARLARLRRALDTLHAEAATTRWSTDTTTDVFAHRGHR
jgi:hypothetical protein